MKERLSTREAAKKLGVALLTLQRHIKLDSFESPPIVKVGGVRVRLCSDRDIEKARKVLAATKPGRKRLDELWHFPTCKIEKNLVESHLIPRAAGSENTPVPAWTCAAP